MDFPGHSRFSSLICGNTVIPLVLSHSSLWLDSAQISVSWQKCILKVISFTAFHDWFLNLECPPSTEYIWEGNKTTTHVSFNLRYF